jgi:creatinine amidohydrolase
MLWSQRTWTELPKDQAAAQYAAILPEAATEQHGPHLGCGVDAVLADKLCMAVAERTRVPMLPTMPYGCSIGHSQRWPGTIGVLPTTLIGLITEIGDWAFASGVRRLFIVNTHVTNAAPLRCALEMLRSRHDDLMVAVFNSATLSPRVQQFNVADGEDWHANAAETSLMLAVAPELVRSDVVPVVDDPDRTAGLVFSHPVNRTSTNGVTGAPSTASAQQGQRAFDWMVEDLTALIVRGLQERPPLDHSYFSSAAHQD